MKYDIYIGQNRHYCVISKKNAPEEALCFIANKWKVAKRNLKLETGWIKRGTLYFEEVKGATEVWIITRMSNIPKSYLK